MNPDLSKYILTNFRRALGMNHIKPYYQPVIRTISRQLCSFEALARWEDPEYGMIRPDQFIPVLEENKLIHLLDSCIIRQVCARMRKSISDGETPIPVSVNLSRLDFTLCDIFAVVDGIATRYQIPHDFLYIEITESIVAENEAVMRDIVAKFRGAGYQVWMDDFGSGYSSLNLLKDYEFDELKLDMNFMRSFSQRSRKILTSVIQMAKEIDIHTLAEGVETQEQVWFLRNIGCEKVQGYYYGKPMPYDDALAHLRAIDVSIEKPQYRKYYDDIGQVNLLSSVPFMPRAERDAITTARQLNSIPLAIVEIHPDFFSVLFYNTAFEETAESAGFAAKLLTQELLRKPQPFTLLPARIITLMDATRSGEEGRMYFISHDEYYEIQAKCIAQTRDAYSVLFRMSNLSKAAHTSQTEHLDEGLRQLYTLFERVTLMDLKADAITPLYVGTREDLLSGRTGIVNLTLEFAERWIFPDDREAFMALMDLSTLEERLRARGKEYVAIYLRTRVGHGQYEWKQYNLLRLNQDNYLLLIRNVHEDLMHFKVMSAMNPGQPGEGGPFDPEHLWKTLTESDIVRMFWKDADRRFLGASQGFLDYYGFGSVDEILHKNDEDLGWHVRPGDYMSDEIRVIHEGAVTHNVPGHCICNGQNRDIIASKAPIYDENGAIQGLIGCFVDRDMLNMNDKRGRHTTTRDMLTGLLNSRGIAEESEVYLDEYNLRNADFVRMHVAIDGFQALNREYGFDFGDKAIRALGRALKQAFGITAAVGRHTGFQFVILRQVSGPEELPALTARVKEIASGIRRIDGIALTLYLSVGCALYSECRDLEDQHKKAEVRLLTDHDEHADTENRLSRASEIFHLYDDLPISYSVYRVLLDEDGRACDAVLFYVNHVYEQRAGMKAAELLGRRTSELFPTLGADWYEKARRAACVGETIVEKFYFEPAKKYYYMTGSPVIHTGYCCFTYQEMEILDSEK